MQKTEPIYVIACGIGPDNISKAAERIVSSAHVIAGGKRLLGFFPDFSGDKIELGAGRMDMGCRFCHGHFDGSHRRSTR